MITVVETRERMNADQTWWQIPLMDFVDDFRRYKNSDAIKEPFQRGDEKMDAILASVAESICDELNLPVPKWLGDVPACTEPYFVAGLENLKAIAIVESPLRFRIRKIFVLENFLYRV
jgi:hypothetical protein